MSVPQSRIAPPAVLAKPSLARPPVIVSPAIVAVTPSLMSKTRSTPPPLMVVVLWPAPSIVVFLVMSRSPLAGLNAVSGSTAAIASVYAPDGMTTAN